MRTARGDAVLNSDMRAWLVYARNFADRTSCLKANASKSFRRIISPGGLHGLSPVRRHRRRCARSGVVGFHYIADAPWIDALHNASMILGGMGPVAEMKTDAAKLFSSAYALFCGLVFITVVAVTLAPVLHRVLHKFHMDEADLKKKK